MIKFYVEKLKIVLLCLIRISLGIIQYWDSAFCC